MLLCTIVINWFGKPCRTGFQLRDWLKEQAHGCAQLGPLGRPAATCGIFWRMAHLPQTVAVLVRKKAIGAMITRLASISSHLEVHCWASVRAYERTHWDVHAFILTAWRTVGFGAVLPASTRWWEQSKDQRSIPAYPLVGKKRNPWNPTASLHLPDI